MLSIVEKEPVQKDPVEKDPPERVVSIDEGRASEPPTAEEPVEYEIVIGRRQMASLLFVAVVVVVAFSAVSYLAGKSLAPKPAPAPEPLITIAAPASVETPPAEPVPQPVPVAKAKTEAPLFADPQSGALYLQLGAVEKGVAVIMVEGLRKREFSAFVAPGPNDHIFRVLIGPLDTQSYQRAKDAVDQLGLSAFARKYQQ